MSLPLEIVAQLLPEQVPPQWSTTNRPIARFVRECLRQRDQTHKDLHRLMPCNKNAAKSYRSIDRLLAGDLPEVNEPTQHSFLHRAFEALKMTPEEIKQLLDEDDHFQEQRESNLQRQRLHDQYRKQGPTLSFHSHLPYLKRSFHRREPRRLSTQIQSSQPNSLPPTAEEISTMIAKLGLLGVVEKLGGFSFDGNGPLTSHIDHRNPLVRLFAQPASPGIWHCQRLPDEIYTFQANGKD